MFSNLKTIDVNQNLVKDVHAQIGFHEKMHTNKELNQTICTKVFNKVVKATNPKNFYTDFTDGKNTYQIKYRKELGFTLDKFLNYLKSDYITYVTPISKTQLATSTYKVSELKKLYEACLKKDTTKIPKELNIEKKVNYKKDTYFKVTLN